MRSNFLKSQGNNAWKCMRWDSPKKLIGLVHRRLWSIVKYACKGPELVFGAVKWPPNWRTSKKRSSGLGMRRFPTSIFLYSICWYYLYIISIYIHIYIYIYYIHIHWLLDFANHGHWIIWVGLGAMSTDVLPIYQLGLLTKPQKKELTTSIPKYNWIETNLQSISIHFHPTVRF